MTGMPDADFESWIDTQLRRSATRMLASISPVTLVKHRPGFGQTMVPVAGAIVASPVLADWDPDPDYFFHWFRDSALVIDALRSLHAQAIVGDEALQHLRDFVRFSLGLTRLDGRTAVAMPDRTAGVAPDFLQFMRDDADLAMAHGDAVAAETRVNPDGTLDLSRWARPQHDGPPLRALAMLRWVAGGRLDPPSLAEAAELNRFDLAFTLRRAREPSYDIWEEELGHHYYTLRVSAAALAAGATWLAAQGDLAEAQRCRDASRAILGLLDGHWIEGRVDEGHYRSRRRPEGEYPVAKSLDIAVMLSAIHAPEVPGAAHGVADPRMQATLARLEALFGAIYPINRGRAAGRGPAMGR
jgi:glucoamylase